MNVLALNLAAEIVNDEKSVEEARQKYAQAATSSMQGDRPEITQRLSFDTSSRNIDRANMPGERYRGGQASGQSQEQGQQDQGQEAERKRR